MVLFVEEIISLAIFIYDYDAEICDYVYYVDALFVIMLSTDKVLTIYESYNVIACFFRCVKNQNGSFF